LQPFDFNTQLLDTSDHEASLLVNHHGVNNFTLAIFYFAEFYPSRRFNSLCSIKPIGRVRSLKVDTKNFQPTIRYLLPTDKLDHVKSFYEAYLDKLKPNTGYVGWLTVPSRSGGWSGLTFPPVYFRTKQKNPTCLLVRKLGFCDSVFHSVSLIDANTTQTNIPTSELLYRSWAENLIGQRQREAEEKYVAFMKALNQYDCKGHPYSPVRDCRDCQASYKAWMCAITFPKCADYLDANDPTNANTPPLFQLGDGAPPTIKPCAFICHFVMQDCPSLLNFRCPMGLNASLESYFPTPRGIWSWAEYELQFRNRPFSANATPPVPSSPFCNAMLSPLRLSHSNLVFKSNSQLASPSFGLALFSLLLLRLVESSHAILGYAIHNDGS
ncbi:stretch-activated cation channel mid1, partial [Massospora cicadina]